MRDLRDELKIKKLKSVDPIDQILDENYFGNITLFDPEKKPIEFEQVAVLQLDDEQDDNVYYTIMIPITPMVGVNEGEGVVFKLNSATKDIDVINDEKVIDKVLELYQELLINSDDDDDRDKK